MQSLPPDQAQSLFKVPFVLPTKAVSFPALLRYMNAPDK